MGSELVLHTSTISMLSQIFSICVHSVVIFMGVSLIRGYYSVFRVNPSNVLFAIILLLSSLLTTSIMIFLNSVAWFFDICLFCELNSHYAWIKILWSTWCAIGIVMLYLIIRRKMAL